MIRRFAILIQLAGRRAVWSFATLGTCAFAQSAEADEIAVTPYRPTVSTPAALSAPDWIEVEMGLVSSSGGIPTARDSAPYSVKLAFSDDWGVRIGGEIWVRDVGASGRNINGIGDTGIVLKRRFAVNERSAFGLELGVMAPTAPAGLHSGSGGTDYGVNAIYSTDFGSAFHTDLNYSVTRLGEAGLGESRDLTVWAAALSYAVDPRWGVDGELSGTRQGGADSTEQLLFAATFSPSRRITWDFGFVRGLTSATPTWSLFAGCTLLVAHL
jgi:hypothetical protein